jgi:hypothetical protein
MRLSIIAVALAGVLFQQTQRFEGTVKARTAFLSTSGGTLTFSEKWPNERFDINSQQYGKAVVLVDFAKGTRTTIIPAKHQYWTINRGQRLQDLAKAMNQQGQQLLAVGVTTVVTPTARTDMVAGTPCKYYKLGAAQNVDACVATNIGQFMPAAQTDAANALGIPTAALLDSNYDNLGSRFPGGYFPLRIVSRASGSPRVVWQVESIQRHAVSDSLFAIPAGYTEVPAPKLTNDSSSKSQ